MTPAGRIQLVCQLRDLQIVDAEDVHCGTVDDIEFEGRAGGPLRIKALLVGPGGYKARLPRWWMALLRLVAGDGVVRVPWAEVESIASMVKLRCKRDALGLGRGEERARRLLPRIGALK